MSNNCKSCGAPSTVSVSVSAPWKCEYCGTSNFNENYIESYLEKINHPRLSGLIDLAKTAFESGNFETAARYFDSAIQEDPSSFESWAYKAISIANTITLNNIHTVSAQVGQCLAKAYEYSSDDNAFVGVADSASKERIVTEFYRAALRKFEQAIKVEHGFSHDKNLAISKAMPKSIEAMDAILIAFQNPSSNVGQMVEMAVLAVNISKRYGLTNHAAYHSAQNFYESNHENYPEIILPLEQLLLEKKSQKLNSCVLASSLVELDTGRFLRMEDVQEGDKIAVIDSKSSKKSFARILYLARGVNLNTITLVSSEGQFTATSSHSLLTDKGPKLLRDFKIGDLYQKVDRFGVVEWCQVDQLILNKNNQTDVYWYFTDAQGFSVVDGVVVSEFSSFPTIQKLILVNLGFWRILKLFRFKKLSFYRPFRFIG